MSQNLHHRKSLIIAGKEAIGSSYSMSEVLLPEASLSKPDGRRRSALKEEHVERRATASRANGCNEHMLHFIRYIRNKSKSNIEIIKEIVIGESMKYLSVMC